LLALALARNNRTGRISPYLAACFTRLPHFNHSTPCRVYQKDDSDGSLPCQISLQQTNGFAARCPLNFVHMQHAHIASYIFFVFYTFTLFSLMLATFLFLENNYVILPTPLNIPLLDKNKHSNFIHHFCPLYPCLSPESFHFSTTLATSTPVSYWIYILFAVLCKDRSRIIFQSNESVCPKNEIEIVAYESKT